MQSCPCPRLAPLCSQPIVFLLSAYTVLQVLCRDPMSLISCPVLRGTLVPSCSINFSPSPLAWISCSHLCLGVFDAFTETGSIPFSGVFGFSPRIVRKRTGCPRPLKCSPPSGPLPQCSVFPQLHTTPSSGLSCSDLCIGGSLYVAIPCTLSVVSLPDDEDNCSASPLAAPGPSGLVAQTLQTLRVLI